MVIVLTTPTECDDEKSQPQREGDGEKGLDLVHDVDLLIVVGKGQYLCIP